MSPPFPPVQSKDGWVGFTCRSVGYDSSIMVAPNHNEPPARKAIEVNDHLERAVDELRALGLGEAFDISIRGRRVARFVPLGQGDSAASTRAVEFIRQFGQRHSTGGAGWKAFRDEGRR